MDKHRSGRAYIMVVFVSFPILLAALTALAVSVNSRNISVRQTDFFGMYELASAATVFAIHIFEEAYLVNRRAAHVNALLHFVTVSDENNLGLVGNFGEIYYNSGGYDVNDTKNVYLPADYIYRFKYYLLPGIREHLVNHFIFSRSGNNFTRSFTINLDTDHVFNGTMRITLESGRIIFLSQVTKASDNIIQMRLEVRGIAYWPDPVERNVCLCETNIIKNLDFFTPRVVELKKLE